MRHGHRAGRAVIGGSRDGPASVPPARPDPSCVHVESGIGDEHLTMDPHGNVESTGDRQRRIDRVEIQVEPDRHPVAPALR